MYKDVQMQTSFLKIEEEVLDFWQKNKIFLKSTEARKNGKSFVFYDGPPFATGLPHFGNFVPSVLKDIIPRYKTMQGYFVSRRWGWDCHGVPIEKEVQNKLNVHGYYNIKEYGVEKFNEECRSIVQKYAQEWETIINRLGRWVSFSDDYKTMDINFMESVWWILKELFQKGLIYKGYAVVPFSTGLSTTVSKSETEQKDINEVSVSVRVKIAKKQEYFVVWTTTPWTLPSNLGLCVNANIKYIKVKDSKDQVYILAKDCIQRYFKSETEYTILQEYKGLDLEGIEYEPVFSYYENLKEKGAFRVFSDNYVTATDGSGIVHLANGFGEDDERVLKENAPNLPTVCPIDMDCKFTSDIKEYEGVFVKDSDNLIIQRLKESQILVKKESHTHSYPFCQRTGKPIIYRATSTWLLKVKERTQDLLKANSKTNWIPSYLKEGRFGKWLAQARDWNISRTRFWGNPIPIWIADDDSGYMECIGSVKELEEKTGSKITDLHSHFIDKLTYKAENGKSMIRTPEVLDCWFESGSMPYGHLHYPFENKEFFENNFPADFISEGIDQTRGWFYTLSVISTALFDKAPFKNVLVNGLVLASDGKKMSKSLKNYTDPVNVINKYGADALRMFLVSSSIVQGKNLKYNDDGVNEILKTIIIPFWNSYSFFVKYANIDNIQIKENLDISKLENSLDKWIISTLEIFTKNMINLLDNYHVQDALTYIFNFIDDLNNFYIRRCRRRFWKSVEDDDKLMAYKTLYEVLKRFSILICPYMPFLTEEIYQNLKFDYEPESIHLNYYPKYDDKRRSFGVEEKIEILRKIIKLGRSLRFTHKIKTRQPLSALYIVCSDKEAKIAMEFENFIKEELNVKQVLFKNDEEEILTYSAKPVFPVLGKQLGKDMKECTKKIKELTHKQVKSIMENGSIIIDISSRDFSLNMDNIEIVRNKKKDLEVLNEGTITLGLDTNLTQELKIECLVRDLTRNIQNLRKELDFNIVDRINIKFFTSQDIKQAILNYEEYLKEETLCVKIDFVNKQNDNFAQIDFEQGSVFIGIEKS